MNNVSTLPAPPDTDHDGERLDFEIARMERIERLYARAKHALTMATRFWGETAGRGDDPQQDHRVAACIRQVRDYRSAIARLRAMQFADVDTVLLVGLREDLIEAAE